MGKGIRWEEVNEFIDFDESDLLLLDPRIQYLMNTIDLRRNFQYWLRQTGQLNGKRRGPYKFGRPIDENMFGISGLPYRDEKRLFPSGFPSSWDRGGGVFWINFPIHLYFGDENPYQ